MPIRIRILLVSLVAVIAVGSAFYREYAASRHDVAQLAAERDRIGEGMALSGIIHQLQRERGLTAGYLIDLSPKHWQLLQKQRAETDRVLAGTAPRRIFPAAAKAKLMDVLRKIRAAGDSGDARWPHVREVYTGQITRLLDTVARADRGTWAVSGENPLFAVTDLAVAREDLGLVRATLYRIYTRNSVEPQDVISLAGYYGAFSENLRLFLRDTGKAGRASFAGRVQPGLHQKVLKEIAAVMGHGTGALTSQHPAPLQWWEQATRLIDQLKGVEDGIDSAKLHEISDLIQAKRSALYHYGAFAVASTVLVAALALFAVMRILTALSILLRTLGQVMETEDFGVRIPVDSGDEFERIGTSINSLLGYTDAIIRQKELLASTDLLTQLKNRRHFLEIVEPELHRSDRYGNPLSLILCDIDRFKSVNDRFGHDVGDIVLREFSALLRENVRESDIIARWGGEEFVIAVPEGSIETARGLAEKLRKRTESLNISEVGRITASFGLATRAAGEAFDDMFKRADQALYSAKEQGRNRICPAA